MDIQVDSLTPFFVFAIPTVAVTGAFVAKITRMLAYQRLAEMAHRERIAAIERGADPDRLRALFGADGASGEAWSAQIARRWIQGEDRDRAQRLMTAGIVWLALGASLAAMLQLVGAGDRAWAVGIVPAAVGIAMLACASLVGAGPKR